LKPKDLIGVINDNTNDRDIEIGAIDIMGTFSFFEVPEAHTDKILNSFQDANYNGRDVRVEQASADGNDGDSDSPKSRYKDNSSRGGYSGGGSRSNERSSRPRNSGRTDRRRRR